MDVRELLPNALLSLVARLFTIRRKLLFVVAVNDLADCKSKVPATYRLGTQTDLPSFSLNFYGADPQSERYSRDRLNAGDHLILAELDGQTVFSGWVMFGQIDMGFRNFYQLGPASAASYRLFTRKTLRGNRLSGAYFPFLRAHLQSTGTRRVVSWVEGRNVASRRAHESAGFRFGGVVWHIRCLGRSWFWMSPSTRSTLSGNDDRAVSNTLIEDETA